MAARRRAASRDPAGHRAAALRLVFLPRKIVIRKELF